MAGNEQHIQYGGTWWTRVPDGTWYRWNLDAQQWEAQPAGPPSTPPPAPKPPSKPAEEPAYAAVRAPTPAPLPATTQPTQPARPIKVARSWRPHLDLPEGPAFMAVLGGAILVLVLFGFIAVKALTQGGGPPKVAPLPEVSPYSGPVTWHGQRVIYQRARSTSACIPDNLSEIERPNLKSNKLEDRIQFIARGTAELRGLKFHELPTVSFVSERKIVDNLEQLNETTPDTKVEDLQLRVLKALGAVPEDFNFGGKLKPGFVLGFYDPVSKALFVRNGVGRLKILDELTLSHELEHALADQNFGLDAFMTETDDLDVQLARRALIEGDAVLSASQFELVLGSSDIDLVRVADAARTNEVVAPPRKTIPYFYLRNLLFPYNEGALFACELHAYDGWSAVTSAYTDPPPTTADVLYPGRYIFKITPVDPEDPPSPGTDWAEEEPFTFGASSLLWLLQAPGGEPRRKLVFDGTLAQRWNGGEVHAWTRGKEFAFALTLVDGQEDARGHKPSPRLCERLSTWAKSSFPDAKHEEISTSLEEWRTKDQSMVLTCLESGTRLAVAPTLQIARSMSSE
jgi:hypothetical protein